MITGNSKYYSLYRPLQTTLLFIHILMSKIEMRKKIILELWFIFLLNFSFTNLKIQHSSYRN